MKFPLHAFSFLDASSIGWNTAFLFYYYYYYYYHTL